MTKIDRQEVLLGRLLGREDRPADWQELRALAALDFDLWQRLLADMEGECLLRAASAQTLENAQRVELPSAPIPTRLPPKQATQVLRRQVGTRSLRAFTGPLGWVAASVMALCFIATPPRSLGETGGEISAVLPVASTGDFVTELPRVLVSTESNAAGDAFEVLYMRRILERVRIDEILSMQRDEAGQAYTAALSPADYRPAQSY